MTDTHEGLHQLTNITPNDMVEIQDAIFTLFINQGITCRHCAAQYLMNLSIVIAGNDELEDSFGNESIN